MKSLLKYVQDEFITQNDYPEFKSGDTITVYYEIKEGEKSRTQFFKGVVIQIKGTGKTKTFTIRKMTPTKKDRKKFDLDLQYGSIREDRIAEMLTNKKIEVNKKGKVRRSRIYYFKELRGKKARIKEVKK